MSGPTLKNYDWYIRNNWKVKQGRRDCCRDKNNMQYALDLNNSPDKVVLKCRKCGAVHHHTLNETGKYFKKIGS